MPRGVDAPQEALALLDSWQRPILRTLAQLKRRKAADLRGDRAAVDRITRDMNRAAARVFSLSRDGRLFAVAHVVEREVMRDDAAHAAPPTCVCGTDRSPRATRGSVADRYHGSAWPRGDDG